jgi:4a-hydroxytetrahydrobiopterin dehydratase
MSDTASLIDRKCKPLPEGSPAISGSRVAEMLKQIPDWRSEGEKSIVREFSFKNYHETMAFVNAVAWIAHSQDHHPDMLVGYNRCTVRYSTHTVGGISENDFICAAKVNALLA